jgi:hypothetical protein
MKLVWEKCPCGDRRCRDWHIKNLGKFCQGSGFDEEEVIILNNAFEALAKEEVQS